MAWKDKCTAGKKNRVQRGEAEMSKSTSNAEKRELPAEIVRREGSAVQDHKGRFIYRYVRKLGLWGQPRCDVNGLDYQFPQRGVLERADIREYMRDLKQLGASM